MKRDQAKHVPLGHISYLNDTRHIPLSRVYMIKLQNTQPSVLCVQFVTQGVPQKESRQAIEHRS